LVTKDAGGWKWRFGHAQGYPDLNPYVSTWKIAAVIFAVIILIPMIIGDIYWTEVLSWIASFADWWILLFVSVAISYLWVLHHVIGKAWDNTQYAILVVCILAAAYFAHLNGFPH